jgi:hypothetical protein
MNRTRWTMTAAVLTGCFAVACLDGKAPSSPGQEFTLAPEEFDKLHKLIGPGPDESQWMQVHWMPSTNIYAARKKAAEEGKPLLLWNMAAEPLGAC